MTSQKTVLVIPTVLALLGISWGLYILIQGRAAPQLLLAAATRHNLAVAIKTNGIIEPLEQADIYAPIEGFVTSLLPQEGDEVTEGSFLLRLESKLLAADLAEARAALLQAKAAAGTLRDEITADEVLVAEADPELSQLIKELAAKVESMEQEVQKGSIAVPKSGILCLLAVKRGAFVNRGQLLAQIYERGKVRLRAYVDESDLGRIEKGLRVLIESEGMPDRRWDAVIDEMPQELVAQDNRSVGHALCLIEGTPNELIPSMVVKVQILTAGKEAVLAVPRTAVFNHLEQAVVIILEGEQPVLKPVTLGLVTPEEIEILQGIEEGSLVVTNPADVNLP